MRYIANDGKIFDNEEECRKYEKNCHNIFLDSEGVSVEYDDNLSDAYFLHIVTPIEYDGDIIGVGDWVWDETTYEYRNLDEYIDFLKGVSDYFKNETR